jgi:hypothetical protein
MALVGTLEPFDHQTEEWDRYIERVNNYFVANGIDGNERRAAILLTAVGARNYKIISDLASPALPSTLQYARICDLFRGHFTSHKSTIVARFDF